jgi:hypothetical protein
VPISDVIRDAARALLRAESERRQKRLLDLTWLSDFSNSGQLFPRDRQRLEAIAGWARKAPPATVDVQWWRQVHGLTREQIVQTLTEKDRVKDEQIAALADPARNPNPHQREVAAKKLAERAAKRARASGKPLPHAPGLEEYDRQEAAYKAALAAWRERRRRELDEMGRQFREAVAARKAASKGGRRRVSEDVTKEAPQPGPGRTPPRVAAANARRAAERAKTRAGLYCEHCGKPLAAGKANARFCSGRCRTAYWRKRKRPSPWAARQPKP